MSFTTSALPGLLGARRRLISDARNPAALQFIWSPVRTRAHIATSASSPARYRRWIDDEEGAPQPSQRRQPLSPDKVPPSWWWTRDPITSRSSFPVSSRAGPRVRRESWDAPPHPGSAVLDRLAMVWSRTPRWVLVLIGVGGAYYVGHLEQVPGTGRWRFIDVSPGQDKEMSRSAYQHTLAQYAGAILPPSHPVSRRVQRVAGRLVQAISRHPDAQARQDPALWADWDVHVIASEETNAFVLPGGHIFVFTGILPVAQTDDGLAAVIGHEMAHQIARHSAEKMSRMKVVLLAGWGLAAVLGWDPGLTRLGTTLALELPNSRRMESEADYLGLRLMATACYDPSAAAGLWSRMDAREQAETQAGTGVSTALQRVLSTHPVSSDRMRAMHEALPEARQVRQQAGCGEAQVQAPAFASAQRAFVPPWIRGNGSGHGPPAW